MSDFTKDIKGYTLEYFENEHLYLVEGLILPSITQILKVKFKDKYINVNPTVLQRASQKGTEVHDAIENYCKYGIESDLQEVRNFRFLQDKYNFKVLDNEIPVVLFKQDNPIAVGRLDLVLEMDNLKGLGDIKRTSTLDKEYLFYQLNLYRIAYQQTYEEDINFLKGIHLREDKRKVIDIPIDDDKTWDLVKEFMETL